MKILGRLCDSRCTPSECYCERPMLVVDELPSRARATLDVRNGYTSIVGVSDESDIVSSGPAVLLTPGRRGRLVHGSKP